MPKDSIIVSSHFLTPERELSEESKLRLDKGLELLAKNEAEYIIMNGGPGRFSEVTEHGLFVPRGTYPVHSEVMTEYALQKGVPKDRIMIQNYSSDTVGEAYFVKEMILSPNNFMNNIVISSDYHIPRVREIYTKILGDMFKTSYVGVPVKVSDNDEIAELEKKSLELFKTQFGQITNGNMKRIENILYTLHGIYSKIPKEEQKRYY